MKIRYFILALFSGYCYAMSKGIGSSRHDLELCFDDPPSCELGIPAWRLGSDNSCEMFLACPYVEPGQLFLSKIACEKTCLRVIADLVDQIVKVDDEKLI